MDFKQLEAFTAVAKHQNFSRAAAELFLTQPTVSSHIQNLESELGARLVNRDCRQVSLTPAGELLFSYALDLINRRDQAVFSLGQQNGTLGGVLEISASTIPEQYFLPKILVGFSKLYPGIRFTLMKYDSQQVINKLLAREIDFGIVGSVTEHPSLEYLKIFEDQVILIGPGTLESPTPLTTQRLGMLPLILREKGSGTRKTVEQGLNKLGIILPDLNVKAVVEDNQTITELVAQGLGYAFVSSQAADPGLYAGAVQKIEVEGLTLYRNFYFVYHTRRVLSPLAETFKDYLMHKISDESRGEYAQD